MTGGEEGEDAEGGEGVVGKGEDEEGGVGVVVEVVVVGRGDGVGAEDERGKGWEEGGVGTEMVVGGEEEGIEGGEGGDWVEGEDEKSRRLIWPLDGVGLGGACPDVGVNTDGPAVMGGDAAVGSFPDCGMWWSVTTVRRGSKASSFADPRSVNHRTSWTVCRSRTFSSSNCLTNSTS